MKGLYPCSDRNTRAEGAVIASVTLAVLTPLDERADSRVSFRNDNGGRCALSATSMRRERVKRSCTSFGLPRVMDGLKGPNEAQLCVRPGALPTGRGPQSRDASRSARGVLMEGTSPRRENLQGRGASVPTTA
jgi:hypothetical protein